jgi:hypothetical protein
MARGFFYGVVTGMAVVAAWIAIRALEAPPAHEGSVSPVIAAQTAVVEACTKIAVYSPKTKKDLRLPKDVQDDSKQKVVAAIDILDDGHDHTVSGVYSFDTGVVKLYDQQHQLAPFAFTSAKALFVDYGIKNSKTVLRFGGEYDVLRIGSLHGGATLHVDSDGAYFAGVGLRASWR